MSSLNLNIARAQWAAGGPVELVMAMTSDKPNNVLIIERRLQLQGGGYPKFPDWVHRLYLGPTQQAIADLTTLLPGTPGTYLFTVSVSDGSGTVFLIDTKSIQVNGVGDAPYVGNSIDFSIGGLVVTGRSQSVRVVYVATTNTGGLLLEWNVYRILQGGTVDSQPMRTTRYDLNTFYQGDLQFIAPNTDQPDTYVWEFRIIDNVRGKVLSSVQRDVRVISATYTTPKPLPLPLVQPVPAPPPMSIQVIQEPLPVPEPQPLLTVIAMPLLPYYHGLLALLSGVFGGGR